MNKEYRQRIKRAGEYQKKAIMELLPAESAGHIEVIARELKALVTESVIRFGRECAFGSEACAGNAGGNSKAGETTGERVKKVDIQ
ncbi:MAG: hypothetical protein IKR39_08925 [Lachnospiraceae bacterium]|nr:hypothetical protein [Lachnospiraceae bacterium]